MAKTTIASELHARELMSFLMMYSLAKYPSRTGAMETWRNDADVRALHRMEAGDFMAMMEDCGLRVSISSSQRVLKTIDDLLTIPARPAYLLEVEAEAIPDYPDNIPDDHTT
jgi:hypothetical protein